MEKIVLDGGGSALNQVFEAARCAPGTTNVAKTFVHARLVTPDERPVGLWLPENLAMPVVAMPLPW